VANIPFIRMMRKIVQQYLKLKEKGITWRNDVWILQKINIRAIKNVQSKQHWAHKTQDEDKQETTTHQKMNNTDPPKTENELNDHER
jgi:hypothetical protein